MKAFSRTTAAAAVALAGALVSTNAPAVNLATDGVGQVAIAPLYTARNGWTTAINLTNTTNVPLLVKVRFHEGHNSRDVLDFNVALSAFDVFTGVVQADANGSPVFVNTDSPADGVGDSRDDYTCTIPSTRNLDGSARTVPLNHLGFSGDSLTNYSPLGSVTASNDDGGLGGNSGATANAQAIERLKEGYVEFIVMGHADPNLAGADVDAIFPAGPTSYGSTTVPVELDGAINVARAIEQHDCSRLQTALGLYNQTRALQSARQFGQPVDALKFTFALINPQGGLAAAAPATTWANFYSPANGSGALNFGVPAGFVFPSDNFLCDIPRGAEHFTTDTPTNWCPEGSGGADCTAPAFAGGPATAGVTTESCRNLVTMQDTSEFLEPTLNDAYPHNANGWLDSLNLGVSAVPRYSNSNLAANAPETTRGVDALSLTIQRQRVFNQFSNNTTLGARTEAIITQPTKAFYVDQGNGIQFQIPTDPTNAASGGAGTASGAFPRNEAYVDQLDATPYPVGSVGIVPYAPYENRFAQETANDRTSARACNQVAFGLYDRAENPLADAPPGEPPFSPAPPPESDPRDLCYETTVISFGPTTLGGAPEAANRLDISDLIAALAAQTGNKSGWFSMVLGPDANNAGIVVPNQAFTGAQLAATLVNSIDAEGNASIGGTDVALSGLPVIGFTLATLNFPSRPDLSFGSAAEHSYSRTLLDDIQLP